MFVMMCICIIHLRATARHIRLKVMVKRTFYQLPRNDNNVSSTSLRSRPQTCVQIETVVLRPIKFSIQASKLDTRSPCLLEVRSTWVVDCCFSSFQRTTSKQFAFVGKFEKCAHRPTLPTTTIVIIL